MGAPLEAMDTGPPVHTDVLGTGLRDLATLRQAATALMARYELPSLALAARALGAAAHRHHVDPDALARALLIAPRPLTDTRWFPSRVWRSAPELGFQPASDTFRPTDLLRATLNAVIDRAQTSQGDIQTVTPGGTGLVLKHVQGFSAEFVDHFAHVDGDATACAIAMTVGEPITVPDVATCGIFDRPALDALIAEGVRAVYSVPLTGSTGRVGVVSVHYRRAGRVPTVAARDELSRIATRTASWLHWYRRTATLDALEDLHEHRGCFPD